MKLLVQFLVVVLLFIAIPSHAQNAYYAPEGKTFLSVSKNKIVLKFAKGISFEQQRNLLAKEILLSPLSQEQVLPAPKLTLVDLQAPQDEKALYEILARLESQPEILFAHPFLEHEDGTLHGITDQLIVRLNAIKDELPMRFLLERYGAKIIKANEFDPLQFHIQVDSPNGRNALIIANSLYETGLFEFSEPDFLRLMKRMNTSDAFVNQQWALNNDGTNTDQYGGIADADMKVFDAWGSTTGSSEIKIAILDEGVDLSHPDLQANLLGGYDATGQGSAGAPSGDDAHGTACAGIAAGVGNNGIGISGVAFGCKIIPVRIAYSSGSNWVTSNSWIGNAINWAWQTGNADVLSNSWGGGGSSSIINNAITNATNDGRGGLGSPVLFAAGNDNGANSYPATFEPTISVVAMSMCNERKSPTSCDGESWWGSNYGTGADVAAPGVKIYATDISGPAGYNSGDYLSNFNGTSSACPNAAGVMALILSANSNLTEAQARATLEGTCDKVGGYTYVENVIGQSAGSWSQELGYGRINAAQAIASLNCNECLLCTDGIQNGQETGVDCGGPFCPTCPTCDDGVQNGDETGIDCGGPDCEACACFASPLKLTINFDHYPEETSWNIRTQSGISVASGGTYGSQPDLSTLIEDINIGDGEYIFTLSDAYGDGICCNYGQGSFSLEDANGAVILTGSQFQASISESFCASVPTSTCDDGIQNGDETGVDCGGTCEPCITCDDGIQNGDETGVDCGGACEPCITCDDGIQNGDETGVDCGGDCEPCQTGECSIQIIEANDFEDGWGIWIDGGSDARRSRGDRQYARSGLYCIRLRDDSYSSVITTEALNLENFEEVTVDFSFIARSMDNRQEDFWLQISSDGGENYTTVQSWARNTDFQNNTQYAESIFIEGPFSATTTFRFRCDASSNSDWVYLDDIIISGCALPSSTANPSSVSPNTAAKNPSISGPVSTKNSLSNFHLFPNPASGEINLHFEAKESGNIAIQLTDLSGKIIQQQQQNIVPGNVRKTLDVSRLNGGIYFIRLVGKNTFISRKIIILP